MSHSIRFIGLAIAAWVGVRALSLGLIPGAEAFAFDRASGADNGAATPSSAAIPPLVATQFAPIDPVLPPSNMALPGAAYPGAPAYPAYAGAYPAAMPVYGYGAPMVSRAQAYPVMAASMPAPRRRLALADSGGWSLEGGGAGYGEAALPLDQWPLARIASGGPPPGAAQSTPAATVRKLDRLSMSAWAMLRREPGGTALAANGMLGGSQAGARILYRFMPGVAASLRTSAPVGGVTRGGEAALGIRWQPLARIPLALTAERRQAFGRDAGRSDFALFAEGGVYQRPIFAGFNLDAYLQAGVVGVRERDLFVDGSATLTRPLWRQLSGGFGMWGGAQPGLYRVDAGPRLSWRVGNKMRVHADYRQRLAGTAAPGSGPVLTIAGDF